MQKDKIIINTLAFVEEMKQKGKDQSAYVAAVAGLGVGGIEVRREMFVDALAAAAAIKDEARKTGLVVFYSIPATLYKAGQLDRPLAEAVSQEAIALGAGRAKFNVGDCEKVTAEDLLWLAQQYTKRGVQLTVENDQTQQNGRIEPLVRFAEMCNQIAPGIIDVTYDVGNWIYTGEDPHKAAEALHDAVGYIHLKDVKQTQPPVTCQLGEGDIDWCALTKTFAPGLPVAIEYPCGPDPMDVLPGEIEKICREL